MLVEWQWPVIDLNLKDIFKITKNRKNGSALQHVAINHSSANVGTETRQPINNSWEHIAFHEPLFPLILDIISRTLYVL